MATGNASLAEQAYQILLDRLVMLEIQPGDPMNEQQLASDLDMGRTPIREALKRLETDHLVDNYPRQGTFASRIDIGDLAFVSEMRLVLEPHAAFRAAKDASEANREAMSALAKQIAPLVAENTPKQDLLHFDLGVHRSIYKALDNPYLQETLVRLDNLATRLWMSVLDRVPVVANHVEEHVALLGAIVEGRAEEAAEIARDHVQSFEKVVRAAL
ncbi:MAG: hypothetical protein RL100_413 [Actinomycetota bacterium]|jgi:DNA-binding GntR family transcriptional regulator